MYKCKICGKTFEKPGWIPSVPPRKEQPCCPYCKATAIEVVE